jgi:hypothetical protein
MAVGVSTRPLFSCARARPSAVLGLRRFAAICRSVATIKPFASPSDFFPAGPRFFPQSPGLKPPAPALQSGGLECPLCSEAPYCDGIPATSASCRSEIAWWQSIKIDPLPVANRLWQRTRPSATTGAFGRDTGSTSAAAITNESGADLVANRSDPAGDPRPDGRVFT